MNDENLVSLATRSERERKEIAKKGQKASVESRLRRKTLKEELNALLDLDNNQNRVSLALLQKAAQGDVKAFEVLRDTIGEKPTDKQEINYGNETLQAIEDMSVDAKRKALDDLISKVGGSE